MKLYLRYQIVVCAAILLGVSALEVAASASSRETITIAGTGSGIGMMQLMAKAFQKKHPGVIVNVFPSIGSTGGIMAVTENRIDIGVSYRSLKPEERSENIIVEPYGRTPFIFGVQNSNPTHGLTLAEIEEMYNGKRKTWPDGTLIRLVLRPVSDGYTAYLAGINPGLKSASVMAHSVPGVFIGDTDQDAAIQSEKTSGSFGTTTLSLITSEKRKIKALFIDGVAPTTSNVSSGKYPYAITLYLVYKKDTYKAAVKDFIEFVFSREGKKLLSDNGHVTLQRRTTGK